MGRHPLTTLRLVDALACVWCDAIPGSQHDRECPNRDDEPDFPAYCARCGVAYITNCACDGDD